MRQSRAPLRGRGVFFAAQFSAGYITNMPGFDLRQAQPAIEYRATLAATLKPALGLRAGFVLYCVSFQLLFKNIERSKRS